MALSLENNQIQIIQVWNDNLEKEFAVIRKIVDDYPNIAMVINFPGVVVRPVGNFKTNSDYNYQTLKANVDVLKLIQLGLTFSDEVGNLPTCGIGKGCVWQFNFREFNLSEDLYENDSIELLQQSGINFEMSNTRGIDVQKFAELLMSSGVVLNKDVNIVTFDGGYNFGYLVKLLKGMNLPDTLSEFYLWGKTYFPTFYDIKHLLKFCDGLDDGLDLNKLAEILGEERMGNCRQAGSHSLLTSATFKKMKESFLHGSTEIKAGVLYGLSVEN